MTPQVILGDNTEVIILPMQVRGQPHALRWIIVTDREEGTITPHYKFYDIKSGINLYERL